MCRSGLHVNRCTALAGVWEIVGDMHSMVGGDSGWK